ADSEGESAASYGYRVLAQAVDGPIGARRTSSDTGARLTDRMVEALGVAQPDDVLLVSVRLKDYPRYRPILKPYGDYLTAEVRQQVEARRQAEREAQQAA